jgi:uncharacterized damage-inducible protein DinB
VSVDPRYPIGTFPLDVPADPATRARWIEDVAAAPAALRAAVSGLDETQLETPYRDGGWTVRQVAHHIPDSHVNAYVRFKLALTEDDPAVKSYEEDRWAELADGRAGSVEVSVALLEALHERWLRLLRAMSDTDFERGLLYPPQSRRLTLGQLLGLYAWHGRHHVAQITTLRERQGWRSPRSAA